MIDVLMDYSLFLLFLSIIAFIISCGSLLLGIVDFFCSKKEEKEARHKAIVKIIVSLIIMAICFAAVGGSFVLFTGAILRGM